MVIGETLGPYRVLAKVGEGGMGEVYRARDTRLDRSVAIKILHGEFGIDPERLRRFDQEARAAAALNHPNILAVYDSGDHRGSPFIVSELLEGQTLREVLDGNALPVKRAVGYVIEIARGLAAAHEHGIVHRDLKPENVFITADDRVKILDFGLAKLTESTSTAIDGTAPPTKMPGTQAGAVLGTVGYMSPEQVRGLPADHRSDLFALGAILYESLTGVRAFRRDTPADTMTAVLREEPPEITVHGPRIPPALAHIVERCLAKSASARFQSAHDLAFALQTLSMAPSSGEFPRSAPSGEGHRRHSWVSIVGVFSALAAVAAMLLLVRDPAPTAPTRPLLRLDLNLPVGVELATNYAPNVALSPDGTRLAFLGLSQGVRQLYVRALGEATAAPIRGSEAAQACFFSPDGNALAFVGADRTLNAVTLSNGLVTPIARDVDYAAGGGVWGADGRVTYAGEGVLWQVAIGGEPQRLTSLNTEQGEVRHAWPAIVGGGNAVLFTSITGNARSAVRIEAVSRDSGSRRVIVEPGSFPLYLPSGHLVFFRDGALLAAPFDVDRLAVTGPPVRVIEDVAVDSAGAPLAAVSDTGILAYTPSGAPARRLVWVSRQGIDQPISQVPGAYQNPRLSPDNHRLSVQMSGDVWVHDLRRQTFTRLTPAETSANPWPIWSPDASRVIFQTLTGLRSIETNGSGRSDPIGETSLADIPSAVSPDGRTLAFMRRSASTSSDIYALSLHGTPNPYPIVSTRGFDGGAHFSPDGRAIVYSSNEAGRFEVYVSSFPPADGRWPVSTQGGTHARWSPTGKELFYRDGDKMMVVDVTRGAELSFSQPRVLFTGRYAYNNQTSANYDVSADGQQFVMVKEETASGRLNVVLNWSHELEARAPAK
jgi:serine/threonine protein kinase/Tol biopolymer transport system component